MSDGWSIRIHYGNDYKVYIKFDNSIYNWQVQEFKFYIRFREQIKFLSSPTKFMMVTRHFVGMGAYPGKSYKLLIFIFSKMPWSKSNLVKTAIRP